MSNKVGEKKELGIKSIPFSEVETFQPLALMAPHEPSTYPIIQLQDIKVGCDVIIDMGIFQNSPFQIEMYLVRGDKDPVIKPAIEPNTCTADIHCGDKETYTLLVRCKQMPEMIGIAFPPQTIFGTIVVNKNASL